MLQQYEVSAGWSLSPSW